MFSCCNAVFQGFRVCFVKKNVFPIVLLLLSNGRLLELQLAFCRTLLNRFSLLYCCFCCFCLTHFGKKRDVPARKKLNQESENCRDPEALRASFGRYVAHVMDALSEEGWVRQKKKKNSVLFVFFISLHYSLLLTD